MHSAHHTVIGAIVRNSVCVDIMPVGTVGWGSDIALGVFMMFAPCLTVHSYTPALAITCDDHRFYILLHIAITVVEM